jgi:hypothetical protein
VQLLATFAPAVQLPEIIEQLSEIVAVAIVRGAVGFG